MKVESLPASLAAANDHLFETTGLKPGGPTGHCWWYVMRTITGDPRFDRTPFSPINRGGPEPEGVTQQAIERDLGIVRAGVYAPFLGTTPVDVLTAAITSRQQIGHAAVLGTGDIYTDNERSSKASHLVAVAIDHRGPHGVIDSLAPGGFYETTKVEEIDEYLRARFTAGRIVVSLALSADAPILDNSRISDVPLGGRSDVFARLPLRPSEDAAAIVDRLFGRGVPAESQA